MRDEEKLLLLGGVGVGLLIFAGAASASSSSRAGAPLPTPSRYARGKLSLLTARYNGALGAALRVMVPIAMPGGSVSAVLGFSSIGGADEDTAPTHNPVFHECGEFQTECGPAAGPAPNPNPLAPYNRWGLLAAEEEPANLSSDAREARALVVRLLGRRATMVAGGWRGADAVNDRAAIALASFWLYARSFARQSSSLLPLEGDWDLWRSFCAFSSFSAGTGGALGALSRYRAELSRVEQSERFSFLCRKIALDVLNGQTFSPPRHHPNVAYTTLRGWQKLASGALLAQELSLDSSWYASLPSSSTASETERLVALGAEGRTA